MFWSGQKKFFERPAVQKGRIVKRTWGDESEQLPERHHSDDFKKFDWT